MLIAWPISYFTAKTWLANFAYKIEINHVVFVLVGTVVLALAMAIVGVITFKVAQDNPVKSLRTD
jgi:putative ABC transport system permease protein